VPRYDYKCTGGHKYELTQPFGSPTTHPCQKCGKEARRVLVAPPLVFKADGYYKTSGRNLGSGGADATESGGTSSNRSSTPPKKLSDDNSPAASEKKAKRVDRVKGVG